MSEPPPSLRSEAADDTGPLLASSQGSHWFRGYGLLFQSEIAVPEMTLAATSSLDPTREPDVRISVGSFPDHLDDPIRVGDLHEANAEQFLLRVKDVGRYLVSKGSEIKIDPHPDASEHDVRVFLLGSCLGGLLHQRGFLVLHASGIGTERGAVLFMGDSGAGKSTILAELMRRGYRMMVDDVCAVTAGADGQPLVMPSYPRTRLWREAAGRLAIDVTDLPRTRDNMEKFERQLPEQFWDREAPLARIFHLAGSNGDELSLTALGPMEAFHTVLNNTYRQVLLDGLDRRQEHFALASLAARSTTVSRIVRPTEPFLLCELADLIVQDLE